MHTTSYSRSGVEINSVLRNTYLMLALTMVPTVLGAFFGSEVLTSFAIHSPIVFMIVGLVGMFGLMGMVFATKDSGAGIVSLLLFTGFMGMYLGPTLNVVAGLEHGVESIWMAAGATGIVFLSLSTFAVVTRKDFGFMGNFLFSALILLLVASIANLFFHIPAFQLAIAGVGTLIFSGYILYDISEIVHERETNYLLATLSVYLDIMNLFINLLQLIMALTGNDD